MGNVTKLKVVEPVKKPRRRRKKKPAVDMAELERRSALRTKELQAATSGGSLDQYVRTALAADPSNNLNAVPVRWWQLRRRLARWIRG